MFSPFELTVCVSAFFDLIRFNYFNIYKTARRIADKVRLLTSPFFKNRKDLGIIALRCTQDSNQNSQGLGACWSLQAASQIGQEFVMFIILDMHWFRPARKCMCSMLIAKYVPSRPAIYCLVGRWWLFRMHNSQRVRWCGIECDTASQPRSCSHSWMHFDMAHLYEIWGKHSK